MQPELLGNGNKNTIKNNRKEMKNQRRLGTEKIETENENIKINEDLEIIKRKKTRNKRHKILHGRKIQYIRLF